MKNSLNHLGWDEHFETHWQSFIKQWNENGGCPGLQPARVLSENRGVYTLALSSGQIGLGGLRGKFRHEILSSVDLPVTGDFIAVKTGGTDDRAMIEGVLARKSTLGRKAAGSSGESQLLGANVDTTFIVTSFNRDLNLRRLERYVSLVWNGGSRPVIVLTKADLADDALRAELVAGLSTVAAGIDVYAVNALTGEGVEGLRELLGPGKTGVLIGSSGVGKSTLTNRLLGVAAQETFAIREEDARGRHTTTSRQLFELPGGGCLIDTPGMRELALAGDDDGIGEAFAEIERWMSSCRFTNCRHGNEPGCAVRSALERGELSPERLESYRKLKREAEFAERKTNKVLASQTKELWKKRTQQAQGHMKRKRWSDER